jgi:hypothetical protein
MVEQEQERKPSLADTTPPPKAEQDELVFRKPARHISSSVLCCNP